MIDDILKLDNNVDNLNVILEYINQTLSQVEYEAAIYKYLKIASSNNLDKLVLTEGSKSLEKVKDQSPTEYRQLILSIMIKAAINQKKYQVATEFIEVRKDLLPIMEQYQSLLDELNVIKAKEQDPLEVLLKLKLERLPRDLKISILEEILENYLNKENYFESLVTLEELKKLAIKEYYDDLNIKINYMLKEYVLVSTLAPEILKKRKSAVVAIYYIATLIKLDKLILASSLEAEYEMLIDQLDNSDVKLFAYNTMIHLYETMDNKISVDHYQAKVKSLTKQPKSKTTEPVVKTKEVIKVKEIKTQSLVSNAKYLEHFEMVLKLLIESHQIDLKLPFREYLREVFIKINEKVNFKEAILYLNGVHDSNLFNYKKQRLYDKKVLNEYFETTIIKETLHNKDDIFGSPHQLLSKKDVLTQKNFTDDILSIYSFYINKDCVLVFYLDEELKDMSLYYELFSGIAAIINTRIIDELNVKTLQSDGRKLSSVLNNNVIAVRQLTKYHSNYNNVATKMFNIDSKHHLELFLRDLSLVEAKEYQEAVERLFSYPNETKVISYTYKSLSIVEYMYAFKDGNRVTIYSFFTDVSNFIKNEELLINKATVCHETKLLNKYSFEENISRYFKEKATFVLVELNQDLASIYGYELLNHFFVEFAAATKKHFNDYDLYRFGFNQLLIVFNFNDIRTVNNELNNYFRVINHLTSKVLKYEKFEANAGVLRYPVATPTKDVVKLLKFLEVSLQKSKSSKEQYFVHFIQADYEKEVFEQEVIDYLNVALENKQLSLTFKQIIDLNKNIVWNYESMIYLPNINIDERYLFVIAKRRKKLIDLEYYHFEAVCSFLKELEKATNYLIKITIPISKETFRNNDFVSFIIGTLKKYKIGSEFIRLLIDIDKTNNTDSLKITELINSGIAVDTTNVETALKNDFNAVHLNYYKLNNKEKQYLKLTNELLNNNMIALILRNVNNKEAKDTLTSLGITYVEGNLYQKITPEEIISKVKDVIK